MREGSFEYKVIESESVQKKRRLEEGEEKGAQRLRILLLLSTRVKLTKL